MENKKIRFGLYGLSDRGSSLTQDIVKAGGEVVAYCDSNPETLKKYTDTFFPEGGAKGFTSFDDFIKEDFDAVLLANYFSEHARYAVKAMRAGKHVLSETIPNVTMAEGVELCRTKEETGKTYALLENYPYFKDNQEMGRLYKSGKLGNLVYAEGDYVHPLSAKVYNYLAPHELHWRNWTPRTFYSTHALAPLMMMTDARPTKVSGVASYHPELYKGTANNAADAAAVIICQTDTNAIFRVIGWGLYAPHSIDYRLFCTKAGVYPVGDKIHLTYNSWDKPEDMEKSTIEYVPEWPDKEVGKLADESGHGGGDFYAVYSFVQAILKGEEPYWDVYRATTASSVAILSWRSILNNNITYDVPDFRKEEDRLKYENDRMSPYPDSEHPASIPCSSQPYKPTEEDLETAREMWKVRDTLLD